MEKIVALIDDMPEYARALAVYLNGRREFPLRAVVFLTPEEVRGYVESGMVYAILAAEAMEKEVLEIAVKGNVRLFWLTETRQEGNSSSLYRYCSAREMRKKLMEQGEKAKRLPVLGLFSPGGGAECELLSRKIAEKLGKRGRVLYLPFFRFGIYGRGMADGMSELLFYVKQGEEETVSHLASLLQKEEDMDAVGPVRWYTDLNGLTGKDIRQLFHYLEAHTAYGMLLAAVGELDRVGKEVLDCCDYVMVPVWETEAGHRVQEEFLRQLRESGETALCAKLLEIPVCGMAPADLEAAAKEAVEKGEEEIARNQRRDSAANSGAV